jgi:hypothetical protein
VSLADLAEETAQAWAAIDRPRFRATSIVRRSVATDPAAIGPGTVAIDRPRFRATSIVRRPVATDPAAIGPEMGAIVRPRFRRNPIVRRSAEIVRAEEAIVPPRFRATSIARRSVETAPAAIGPEMGAIGQRLCRATSIDR